MNGVTMNKQQKLYIIPAGSGGYSCLGFDVAFKWTADYAKELQRPDLAPVEANRGTLAGYTEYLATVEAARLRFNKTGERMKAGLVPQLIGLEGRRVEVVDCHGERRHFKVGKSTGWIPCHLELADARSSGGPACMGTPYKSVQVIS